jgi:hypothetical protein
VVVTVAAAAWAGARPGARGRVGGPGEVMTDHHRCEPFRDFGAREELTEMTVTVSLRLRTGV